MTDSLVVSEHDSRVSLSVREGEGEREGSALGRDLSVRALMDGPTDLVKVFSCHVVYNRCSNFFLCVVSVLFSVSSRVV